jgi:N-ethylmaleimide reductase
MHTGRIGHKDNLPEGAQLVGATSKTAAGQIFTDTLGMQDHSAPVGLTAEGIKAVIEGFVVAANNAIAADFDGVELHAANGYLLEQFLNPTVNNRTDEYGSSIQKRAKLILDVARETVASIGKERTGIRFSPFSTLGDLGAYNGDEVHATYEYLAKELDAIGIAYIHISSSPNIPQTTLDAIRANFNGTLILSNGLTPETAEQALAGGIADLVAFGRPFLANPDFVQRIERSAALNQVDYGTLYTPGAAGYVDYATLQNS